MMNNMQLTANTVMPVEEPYASFLNKSVELFASEKPFYMLRGEGETRGDISRHFRDYFPTRSGRLYNAYPDGGDARWRRVEGRRQPYGTCHQSGHV